VPGQGRGYELQMARKLKVYRTTAGGFFELAVAAPSMKAAAEAWGADPDVFKRGFAGETDDPKVVEAAMAAPGTVLRRPVGSEGAFSEHAALPKTPEEKRKPPKLDTGDSKKKAAAEIDERAKQKEKVTQAEKAKQAAALEKERKEQAAALERNRKRQALDEKKREAERERARKERERLIAKANAEFGKAQARHDEAIESLRQRRKELERRREELDKDEAREDERWQAERRRHEDALRERDA
jgi:colicin import membrane protein